MAKKENIEAATQTTSQELYSFLFEACNILRGPINQDEFKSYVTPILFLKRISDVYDEETEEALKISGGDKEFAAFPEEHTFIIPDGCHWSDIRNTSQNVGKAIVKAMTGIERANPDKLNGLFTSFDDASWTDKSKLDDERLKNLVEHFSTRKLGNKNYSADVMGDAYEYLIKKFADLSKKNAGEFYTPRPVVHLMVEILNPKSGESVYDPACGTGGMLIEAIHYIHDDKMTYGRIYGQEKNLSTSAIARMNLYLHGAKDVQIRQGDTLRDPKFIEKGKLQTFNCVLANPPFSLKEWGAKQFSSDKYGRAIWGTPSDNCADYAWVQHMVKSMDINNGRCAVILPQGALFHKNDKKIREKMIETDLLDTVITLAPGIFFSTGVHACILYFNNHKPKDHIGKILMVDASDIYTAKRAQNVLEENDVNEIFKLFTSYGNVVGKSAVVPIPEIADNEYSLMVNNYIEQPKIETTPPEVVRKNYFAALEKVKNSEAEMKKLLNEGGYLNEQ